MTVFACAPSISAMETRSNTQAKIVLAKTIHQAAPKGYTMSPSKMPELYCAFCEKTIQDAYTTRELGWHIEEKHKRCGECFISIIDSTDLLNHNQEKHPDQIMCLQ